MNPHGRPKAVLRPVVLAVKLRLYPGRDDDLLTYLQSAPPRLRVQYVLQALRTGQLPTAQTAAAPAEEALDFSQLLQ